MHRVLARTGVALIGTVTAVGGLIAAAYATRTPTLHTLPTLPILGALGLIMLPLACVTGWIMHRRQRAIEAPDESPPAAPAAAAPECAATPPDPGLRTPDSGLGNQVAADSPRQDPGPAPLTTPEPPRREPRQTGRPPARAHRRRIRHAPRQK